MRRTSEIVGKAVVSADRGENVGTVADVLVDAEHGRVAALVVRRGVFRGESVLPYPDVQVLGPDTVVARSRAAVVEPSGWRARGVGTRRASRLKHRRVITTSGRQVGEMSDVYIDERSGAVEAYDVETPRLAGLAHRHTRLPYSVEIAVGDDAVVVPDPVGEALDRAGR